MSALDRARAAWGADIPAWVTALAAACDETSQTAVARRLGYSGAVVSTVLARRYQGALGNVELAVRGALMAHAVACPVVGELAADACIAHQRRPWAPHNPQRIAFFRACRSGCPHSRLGDNGNGSND